VCGAAEGKLGPEVTEGGGAGGACFIHRDWSATVTHEDATNAVILSRFHGVSNHDEAQSSLVVLICDLE